MSYNEINNIEKKLDCLIVLNCISNSDEKTKLKIAANCLGLSETARLLGKDPSNFSKSINNSWIKKEKINREEIQNGEQQGN